MMRKLLLMLALVLYTSQTLATEVAVIDFRAALLQSNMGQDAAKGPRQQVAQMEQRLQQANAELEEMAAALNRDELTLSATEFEQRRQALAQRDNAVRNMAATMQRQAQQLEQQLIDELTPQAEGVLKQMIQEKKLDLVLNRQLSLYANVGVDLTAELTRRLNEVK